MTGQEFSYCAESDTCHHMTIILELLISSIFIWPSNSSTLVSILILFDLICLLFILKKHTHLTLYQLYNYSLTASFSRTTNTKCLFFYILYTRFLNKKYNKKKPSYVYCFKLTRTCNSTCMLLHVYWRFLDVLAACKDPAGLSGEVLINGAPQPPNYKCLSGYVVQV